MPYSGSVRDFSGNNLNIQTSGTTSITYDGVFGNALSFSASGNGSARMADNDLLDYKGSGITVSAWVLATSDIGASYRRILQKGYYNTSTDNGGYALDGAATSGIFRWCTMNSSGSVNIECITSTSAMDTTNKWYHIVGTYDGDTSKIYIDGKLENSIAYTAGIKLNSNDFVIGNSSIYNMPWDGYIDHVKIWHRPLTAKEVAVEYSSDNKYNYLNQFPTDNSQWTTGKYGSGLTLDGSDDYLYSDETVFRKIRDQPFTVSTWIKTSTSTNGRYLISNSTDNSGTFSGFTLSLSSSCQPVFTVAGTSTTGTSNLCDNQWHQVTGVFNGSQIMVYSDSNLQNTTNSVTGYTQNVNVAYFGYSPLGGYPSIFSGVLDEIKYYSYPLSTDQIKVDYNNSSSVRF